MSKPLRPIDALMETIAYSTFSSHLMKNPGDVIKRQSEERRKILAQLVSDDIREVRADYIFDDTNTYYQKEFSKQLMNMDKKFRR